jgi:DNA-binding transcriptional LysR family regulator
MLATTRAQAVFQPLRAALAEMRNVVQPQPRFEPAVTQITWQVAAADYGEYAILLPLLEQLRTVAPRIRLAIREAPHSRMFRQLESGTIDVGFLALDAPPERLHSRVLFKEHYVLVARKSHPALKRKLTLDTLASLEYVVVSPEGGGFPRGHGYGVGESWPYAARCVVRAALSVRS